MSEFLFIPYNSQNAAKLVTRDTADKLASNNLKLSIRQSKKSIDPRNLRACSFLGVDMAISDREVYSTYHDFLEQHFDFCNEDTSDYYYFGVERLDDGKMVTVDKFAPWSVDKRVGVIYISKVDIRNLIAFSQGRLTDSADDRAVAVIENEVTLYSIYLQNNIHDVMVSTMDDAYSHTETFVYALPVERENKSNDTVMAEGSRIDKAVVKAMDTVLSKLTN